MKTLKRIVAFALVGAMAFNVVGCGKKTDSSDAATEQEVTTEAEATVEDTTEEATTEVAEVKPIKVQIEHRYESEWNDSNEKQLLDSELQYAYIEDDACPKLKESVKKDYELLYKEDKKTNSNLLDSAKKDKADRPYANSNSITIKRADTKVLSYVNTFYSDMGGAHGYSGNTCFNYNSETGEKIALSDVCKSEDKLIEKIQNTLFKTYKNMAADDFSMLDSYFENVNFDAKPDESGFIFSIENAGVTFYFNPYDIAPYAAGNFAVYIPFDEDLFNAEYFDTPKYYFTGLIGGDNNYVDVDSDGKVDTLSAYISPTEYGEGEASYDKAIINVNGKEARFNMYCYDSSWYFVHSEKGDFIYMIASIENDYENIYVFSTENKEYVELVDHEEELLGLGVETVEEGEDTYYHRVKVPTDCESFELSSRSQVLCTSSVIGEYSVGEDGYPESNGKLLNISSGVKLTLKKDLTLKLVDDDTEGETDEDYTLKAKDKVTLYKTDGKEIVDLKTSDGKVVRAHVDSGSFEKYDRTGQAHNGTDLDKLFKGLFFAG